MKKTFVLAGHGGFADGIARQVEHQGFRLLRLENCMNMDVGSLPSRTILIHVGSGVQFYPALEFCRKHQVPMIQASRNLAISMPEDPGCIIINSSVLALGAAEFLNALPVLAATLKDSWMEPREIVECRCETDRWSADLSLRVATILGMSSGIIRRITDPDLRMQMGIPADRLGEHISITISFSGTATADTIYGFVIRGHIEYTMGCVNLADCVFLIRDELRPGYHEQPFILKRSRERLEMGPPVQPGEVSTV